MRELESEERIQPIPVHKGQHYDELMCGQFFRELTYGLRAHAARQAIPQEY